MDLDLVMKVADLAMLAIPEEDAPEVQAQFSKILEDFKQLQSVDTTGVTPMLSPIEDHLTLREDRPDVENSVEDILGQAPDRKGLLFKVPPVV